MAAPTPDGPHPRPTGWRTPARRVRNAHDRRPQPHRGTVSVSAGRREAAKALLENRRISALRPRQPRVLRKAVHLARASPWTASWECRWAVVHKAARFACSGLGASLGRWEDFTRIYQPSEASDVVAGLLPFWDTAQYATGNLERSVCGGCRPTGYADSQGLRGSGRAFLLARQPSRTREFWRAASGMGVTRRLTWRANFCFAHEGSGAAAVSLWPSHCGSQARADACSRNCRRPSAGRWRQGSHWLYASGTR